MELLPPAVEVQYPNHLTAREFLVFSAVFSLRHYLGFSFFKDQSILDSKLQAGPVAGEETGVFWMCLFPAPLVEEREGGKKKKRLVSLGVSC